MAQVGAEPSLMTPHAPSAKTQALENEELPSIGNHGASVGIPQVGDGGQDLLAAGKTPEIASEIMDKNKVSTSRGGCLDGSAEPVLPLQLPLAINRSHGCVVVTEKGIITSNQWS